jgi:hypothetical protein
VCELPAYGDAFGVDVRETKTSGCNGRSGQADYLRQSPIDVTVTSHQHDGNGFWQVLYFYQRGPGDPPGNMYLWMCETCDQVREKGHAPDCPWLRDEA